MLLNQTTAVVRVYMLVRKSNYWAKRGVPWYDRWSCISTSSNRPTSGWPLYVTSCLRIRERWRRNTKTKLHLCTFRIYIVYMIITQTRCTMALFVAVISEGKTPSLSPPKEVCFALMYPSGVGGGLSVLLHNALILQSAPLRPSLPSCLPVKRVRVCWHVPLICAWDDLITCNSSKTLSTRTETIFLSPVFLGIISRIFASKWIH